MKRKAIFALAVAVALLVAVIPVSTGSNYDYGMYGGCYYEVFAVCNINSYSASVSGTTYYEMADITTSTACT